MQKEEERINRDEEDENVSAFRGVLARLHTHTHIRSR